VRDRGTFGRFASAAAGWTIGGMETELMYLQIELEGVGGR
jgi:hypothetical protein